MKSHEYAEIFPFVSEVQIAELAARIKAHGQREPIVTYNGEILDGRCRLAACKVAGVDPKYREFGSRTEDGDDPLEFVVDTNLHRRHLSDGALALAAGKYATAKVGRPRKKSGQNDPIISESSSEEKNNTNAAEKFNISESKVKRAKRIIVQGVPELQQAATDGEITVSDASNVASQEPKVQRQAVQDVRDGKYKTATASVESNPEAAAKPRKPMDEDEKPGRRQRATFDDKGINQQIGVLRRALTTRAKKFGHSKPYTDCLEAIDSLERSFDRWQLSTK